MGRTKKSLTPWPQLLTLSDEMRQYAVAKSLDAAREFESFKDWCLANDARYASWEAAWRNWCRKAEAFAPKRSIGFQTMPMATGSTPVPYRIVGPLATEYAEVMAQTAEQRAANQRKLAEIIGSIKVK